MSETLVWIAVWSTCSALLGRLRGHLLHGAFAKLVFLPGILVDIVLQSVVCVLTATPIQRVSLFAQNRPPLEYGKCKLGPLGLCISVTLKGLLLLTGTLFLVGGSGFLESGFALPLIDEATLEYGEIQWGSVSRFWSSVATLPDLLALTTWSGVLAVYTVAASLVAGGIRRNEWTAWAATWAALFVVVAVGQWLGVKFGFLSRGWFIQVLYVPKLWAAFSLLVFLTIVLVGAFALVRSTALVYSRVTGPSKASGESR
ncbi:MAG: hypothetical protein AB7O52_06565 [Planctomycetota bacterium]